MTGSEVSNASMAIVHALGALVAGGAERLVAELLEDLAGRGRAPVGLVLLSPRVDEVGAAWKGRLRSRGVEIREGPTERVGARSVAAYARHLKELRPDVLHLHNLNVEMAHLLATPLRPSCPATVRTVHNTELGAPRLARLGFRLNDVTWTVFCSEASRAENEGLFGGRSSVVPNGVRFDWPLPDEVDRTELRRRLGLAPGARHVLSVGRMEAAPGEGPQKGHDVLLEAWGRSQAVRPDAVLHLLGDGPGRCALEAMAGGDPSIHFHGVRTDVRDWMLAADWFVMPSRWEGMPIAALEAIGSGLPCIFTELPALRMLEPPAALWCPPDDVEALADQLLQALRAPAPRPDVGSVRAYRSRHGIERTAERHLKLYQRLLGADPHPTEATGC